MSDTTRIISLLDAEKARLRDATLKGNRFNGARQLVELLSDGKLPPVDGSNLTGIISATDYTEYTAQDNISAYQVITSQGFIANSNTVSQRNKIIGIANVAVLIGFSGTALGAGVIENIAWTWTTGDKIYLNGTVLSVTPPTTGYLQFIGTATASDKIDIQLSQSILL